MIAHYLRRGRKTASGFTAAGRGGARKRASSEFTVSAADKHLRRALTRRPLVHLDLHFFATADRVFFSSRRSTDARKYAAAQQRRARFKSKLARFMRLSHPRRRRGDGGQSRTSRTNGVLKKFRGRIPNKAARPRRGATSQ